MRACLGDKNRIEKGKEGRIKEIIGEEEHKSVSDFLSELEKGNKGRFLSFRGKNILW